MVAMVLSTGEGNDVNSFDWAREISTRAKVLALNMGSFAWISGTVHVPRTPKNDFEEESQNQPKDKKL